MPLINNLRILWLLLLSGAAFWLFFGLKLESNILNLLPKYESKQTNEVIEKVTESINSKVILMAKMPKLNADETGFLTQINMLKSTGYFKTVYYQVDIDKAIKIHQLLQPHRFNLISQVDLATQEQSSQDQSTLGWEELVVQMAKEQLFGIAAINGNQLVNDPLFLFQRYLNQLSQLSAFEFDTSNGYFEVQIADHKHLFAFLELNESAYSPKTQQQVEDLLSSLNPVVNDSNDPSDSNQPNIEWSSFGTVRYASAAYQQAKQEISTVGVGSLIGITLLFFIAFRSLSPLLLSLTVIASGLLLGLAVTLLFFGYIHVFALVFGATIAGVSIDYCFHYLIESQHKGNQKVCLKTLAKPLLLGFSSSALVYLGFTITGYQVLAQISVFSITGLLAVLIQVLLFFPLFIKHSKHKTPTFISACADFIMANPLAKICANIHRLVLLFIVILLMLYFNYQPNDDVRALQSLSPSLKQQETEIKQVLSWQNSDAYLLFQSESLDGVLNKEAHAVMQFRAQGHEVFGVSDLIPTQEKQSNTQALQQELYQSKTVQSYLNEVGLTDPFNKTAYSAQTQMSLVNDPGFKELISQRFIGQISGLWTLVLPVKSIYDRSLLTDVTLIQQAEDTSSLFGSFRVKSTWMLAVAILLLLVTLSLLRYPFKQALSLVLIPVVAGLLALLLSQAMGYHVSLFSILGQLLVLGMGIDYVVFLKESAHPKVIIRALLLSACTTILAFGLLTLSEVAVIKSFGFTVGIGIILVLLMSPAVAIQGHNND